MGLLDFGAKLVGGSQADELDDQTKREAFSQSMLQLAAGINPYGGNLLGDVARGLAGGRQVFGNAAERQATQNMDYAQLAEYWAQRGDPQKAQQYAELAGSGRNEVYGQTVELDDGNIYQLTKSGQPQLLGKAPPKAPKFQGGFQIDSAGNPIAELPMTTKDATQLALAQAAAGRAAESANLSRQSLAGQQEARQMAAQEKQQTRRIEVAKAEAPIKKLEQQLAQLQTATKGASRLDLINPMSSKNAELKSLISQIQLTYKDVAGLGALVGADFTILDGVIQRPETLAAIAGGPERYETQIKQMRKELELAKGGIKNLYGERSTFDGAPQKPKFDRSLYNDYKTARQAAYKSGKYDLVRQMDAEAVADGLILAAPRGK